ncbi:hypothetical protein FRB90_011686 [Tulasnella sp. 427]|nr:hypothetical protein FRB90_011686 [Tulasnella sp. 427]
MTLIDSLPEELLLEVFRIVIPQRGRMKDLVRLSGVCRRWRTIVECVPTLWSEIDGDDGLPFVRKALKLSKDVLLDITYPEILGLRVLQDKIDFVEEVLGSISRWRSLKMSADDLDLAMIAPAMASAPQLESLQLWLHISHFDFHYNPSLKRLHLFGGPDCLPRLKYLDLAHLPIAIAPLQLSGLKSLIMQDIAPVSDEEIFQVLSHSQELELLGLQWPDDSQLPTSTGEPPNSPFIELPCLSEFRLMRTPEEFGRRLLSSIVVLNLRHLEIGEVHPTHPIFDMVSPNIHHQRTVLAPLTTGNHEIKMVGDADECRVEVGGLTIWTRNQEQEPITSNIEPVVDLAGPWNREAFRHADGDESQISDLLHELAWPNESSANGWMLPQLEVLEINLVPAERNDDLVATIKARNAAAAKGGIGAPKRLREIRLTTYEDNEPSPPDPRFKRALMKAADGADVYWYGEKWGAEEGESEKRS